MLFIILVEIYKGHGTSVYSDADLPYYTCRAFKVSFYCYNSDGENGDKSSPLIETSFGSNKPITRTISTTKADRGGGSSAILITKRSTASLPGTKDALVVLDNLDPKPKLKWRLGSREEEWELGRVVESGNRHL